MQKGRVGRLHPCVGAARNELARSLTQLLGHGTIRGTGRAQKNNAGASAKPLIMVACSGGPDSLALAATAAHFARRQDVRVGAIIVNHNLQPGSGEIAISTAKTLEGLGLYPVIVESVTVPAAKKGPEMAARNARYSAFERVVKQTDAQAVLLGHTLDDQAETVLLGLGRGSGTRSLAGMPPVRVHHNVTYLRPFLTLRRTHMLEICAAEGLEPWHDPTNTDQSLTRARIRHSVLPFLETQLGGDVARSLARTAAIAGPDSDYLDALAAAEYDRVILPDGVNIPDIAGVTGAEPGGCGTGGYVVLDRAETAALHSAMRLRVLARAVRAAGGENPGFERLSALDEFAAQHAVAGPVQQPGHVSAYRRRGVFNPATGCRVDALVLVHTA